MVSEFEADSELVSDGPSRLAVWETLTEVEEAKNSVFDIELVNDGLPEELKVNTAFPEICTGARDIVIDPEQVCDRLPDKLDVRVTLDEVEAAKEAEVEGVNESEVEGEGEMDGVEEGGSFGSNCKEKIAKLVLCSPARSVT